MGSWVTPALADHPNWTAQVSPQGTQETTQQILARLPKAISLHPQIIVLEAGTWDMVQWAAIPGNLNYDDICLAESISPSCGNIDSMVQEAINAGIYIIVCTIPPWGDGSLASQQSVVAGAVGNFNSSTWYSYSPYSTVAKAPTNVTLVDLYALLGGLSPMQDAGLDGATVPYLPADTSDGVNPNTVGSQLIEQSIESAIEASKVKGVFQ